MRHPFVAALAWFAALLQAPLAIGDDASFHLRAELVDGSRVVGATGNTSLTVDLGFEGLTIPLERIRRAQRAGQDGRFKIELTNRDVFSGIVKPEPLSVEAIFGKVTLELRHVEALEVLPADTTGWLPTETGLVLYYALDDAEPIDRSAGKHRGEATGVQWLEQGVRDGAFRFDGTGRLSVPHHQDLCPQELTLAAWIRPSVRSASYQFVMGKTNGGSWNQGYGFIRDSGDSENLRFFVNYYTSSGVKAPIPETGWTHIAGTFDGAELRFYVNGNRASVVKLTGNPGPGGQPGKVTIEHTNTPLLFGGDASGYAWQGDMDEIVLYNRPLSDKEIRRLYEAGSPNAIR